MKMVFFLNKLHDGVRPEDYEHWVRTVDYPTARSLPSIIEYTVVRAEGLLDSDDDAPHHYIERVLITNLDDYRRDLASPDLKDFAAEWSSYVAESIAIHGTLIDNEEE